MSARETASSDRSAGTSTLSPEETESSDRSVGTSTFTPGRIAITALVVLVLVFIFESTWPVAIRRLLPEVSMPLWLALGAAAVIGAICGGYVIRRRR
ncbi:DUF1049 domain-containing protein [Streptomyces sp. NPDC059893]|uniref:DUF1049 domain-containing protein n=1 Tax=Streptomyces sp. NPDC059893 TaxID=3346990 RepID=UPI00364CF950